MPPKKRKAPARSTAATQIRALRRLMRELGLQKLRYGEIYLVLAEPDPVPFDGKVQPVSIEDILGDDDEDLDPLSNPETYGRNARVPTLDPDE